MLLAPFLDDGQRILDVFFRVGIGVGVKNLAVGRNHIGNAVGEGRAYNRNVERGVIGFYDRKAGVGADRKFVAPERPMTLAPAAAKFSMFSANSCASAVQTLVNDLG
jgi:hypothetical protein